MSWPLVQSTIQACCAKGSGLPGSSVLWADQRDVKRPEGQHIEIALMGIDRNGFDGYVTQDNPNSTPGDGQEGLLRTTGTRTVMIMITCYGGDAVGVGHPALALSGVMAQVTKDSQYELWAAAGLAIADWDAIASRRGKVVDSTYIEPAASFVLKFWASPDAVDGAPTEPCSFIEHVIVHGEVQSWPDIDFQVDKH